MNMLANCSSSSSRKMPFYLLVALDGALKASGILFLDDGESIGKVPPILF